MTETSSAPVAATADGAAVLTPSLTGAAESGARLRAIIERLPDGIVIVDPQGHIRFANPAGERLFNRTSDELIGTAFGFPVFAGETAEIDIVQRGGSAVIHAEVRVVETEWECEPAKLVSLRDITDRKQAEERSRQLVAEREARLEAEAASRAKSEFLAIMSHELRTPLNAVLGYSELMELGLSGPLTDEMREQIGRIRASAKHLLSLVNDILDLARVEAGRLVVNCAPGSSGEAITSALALVQPQAAAANIELKVPVPGLNPSRFVGDEERVRQILVNLLSNAVKFTKSGGVITIESGSAASPTEERRLHARRGYVFVSVTDNGVGIAEEKLAGIFEPFVQADAGTTRSKEGSGLGLTISRRLARLMGGDITVTSRIGEGSTFTLWMPAEDQKIYEATNEAASTKGEADQHGNSVSSPVPNLEDSPALRTEGLADIGAALLAGMAETLGSIMNRIRHDPNLSIAAGLKNYQIADHLSTYLADIAGALIVIEESGGQKSILLADGIEIQRLISERHGAHRLRLGWTESALRREFMIIREELEQAVLKYLGDARRSEVGDPVTILNRFVDHSEFVAVRSLEALRQAGSAL
ncbi:MAG: ATP-binding protein [Gemmatimonadaceae bacterium]